jgi:hypothetical protein
MQRTEDYRGFRIDAEAVEASGRDVNVRIFALGDDGQPESDPMNTQSYEPAGEEPVEPADLVEGALSLARTRIDELLNEAGGVGDRPRHEIVEDAQAGRPGRLVVPFVPDDPDDRCQALIRVPESYPLDGLQALVLLNEDEIERQPLPGARPDLRGVQTSADVAPGEFHMVLDSAHSAPRMVDAQAPATSPQESGPRT